MIQLDNEIKRYIEYCEKSKELSAHTIKAYKIDLRQLYDFKCNMSISKNDLEEYIESLHRCFKPKTIKRKIAAAKAFVHHLYYKDVIDMNPFDKISTRFSEPAVLPRVIPEHLIHKIISVVYDNIKEAKTQTAQNYAIRNAAIIETLFATGARVSELCSLKADDVDLEAHTVKILGKGARERIVEIENSDVLSILMQYRDIYKDIIMSQNAFFINNRNRQISDQSVRIIVKNLEVKVESILHITPHMFRHSVATLLLEEEVDIRYIQRILGHSSITTTQIYTHVTSPKQKEILKNKHPRNKYISENS